MRRALLLSAALLFLVSTATAYADSGGPRRTAKHKCADTYLRNPDARTSITLTAGTGDVDKGTHEGDVTAFGVGLTYPASSNLSILAGWNRSEVDWNSAYLDTEANVFSIGLKFYLP